MTTSLPSHPPTPTQLPNSSSTSENRFSCLCTKKHFKTLLTKEIFIVTLFDAFANRTDPDQPAPIGAV